MNSPVNVTVYTDRVSLCVDASVNDDYASFQVIGKGHKISYLHPVYSIISHLQETTPSSLSVLDPLYKFVSPIYDCVNPLFKSTGIIPPGLLHLDNDYLIFEKPPTYQNIQLIPKVMDEINYSRNEPILFRIPIPWQVYIVNYTSHKDEEGNCNLYTASVRMLFSDSPIQSFDQNVYLPPLNNLYSNGTLCRPMYSDMEDIERYPKDISGVIQSAYDWVWNSGTNLDLTNCIVQQYVQFADNLFESTILSQVPDSSRSYVSDICRGINIYSYYCGYPLVEILYKAWENLSLENVLKVKWPSPSVGKSMHSDLSSNYSEQLMSYVVERGYVSQEDFHHDEEEDYFFQCGESGCLCMGGEEVDYFQFLKDIQVWPPPPTTLFKSYLSFISENISSNTNKVFPLYFTQGLASSLHQSISSSQS